MFGHRGENRRDMPIRDFIKYVREVGRSVVGPHYRAEIADIRVFGRAACATLVETDYAGHDFVDIFTLARIDGAWKIVS